VGIHGLTSESLRGRHLSYQRSRHTTHAKTSLVKIEGVDDTAGAKYVEAVAFSLREQTLTGVAASISARRSHMSTGDRRRSAELRSASSGAR
jgi:ribosomal protein L35AE/L33A